MSTTDTPIRASIQLTTTRALWLAKQLQFGDEPLTKTVERYLEAAYAEQQRRSPQPQQQAS